ncbi:nephronectin isoform X2 [Rhinatrema bivittatum]|uniref:nephronectin isoform X2 n=1 Tax=Rhinatrema bivittatum TaxID=194408 RepID=UPI00112609F8|nr:nephronectin isoform X2 [Rhinatrema bivittatum]
MELLLGLIAVCSLCLQAAGDFDGRWPRQIASSAGLCRYGSRIDCCWGWARQSWGQCQPVCQPACKHGECVGANKCKCNPGYTGKTCNQDEHLHTASPDLHVDLPLFHPWDRPATGLPSRDLNECGLKPRPCKHRCMNTYGSYKCYCLNGYMLMPDGSCSNARTCSMANCQYGCDVVKGEVHCRCPSPGLQLGPDSRTCVDVDECATGRVVCPRFRKCVNTFGSYICKCHKGFDLMYIGGKYQCYDIDECSVGRYQCNSFARCYNTQGSYKCKCKEGYRGNGVDCTPIPKVMIEPPEHFDFSKDPTRHVVKGNGTFSKGSGGYNNRIPDIEEKGTRWPPAPPRIPAIITPRPEPRTTTRPTPKPTTRPAPKPVTRPAPKPVTRPAPKQTTTIATTTKSITRRPAIVTTEAPVEKYTNAKGVSVDNRIQKEPQKPRGDVFIPRQPGVNNDLFEFEIEKGISADESEAKDDPDPLFHSCNFDSGFCGWIRDTEDDLHWEPVRDPSGGQYLTIPEAEGKRGKTARLVLPLSPFGYSGELCLSFRHKVPGLHSGTLQLFVRKNGAHGPAVWGRNGGHGWRQTRLSLQGAGIKSVIFRGERGAGGAGEIGLDDVSLRKGRCSEDH